MLIKDLILLISPNILTSSIILKIKRKKTKDWKVDTIWWLVNTIIITMIEIRKIITMKIEIILITR